MIEGLRIRAAAVSAAVLCSAIGCASSGGGGSPLSPPELTSGCGTVIVSIGSDGGAGETQYRVERSTDGGKSWTPVAALSASPAPVSVTLTGQPAQMLQFRYFASDGMHETGPSPVATAVPLGVPDAPTGVDALPGSSRATVTWQLPASDHGSPFTLAILADETGVGNRYQFPAEATAARALVGDQAHPLADSSTWSFRISAANQCGAATSDPSPAIRTLPWSLTPTDKPLVLGTTLYAMGQAQVDGTQYLIGGTDDQFWFQGATLRTRQDPTGPEDGRLLPWQQSGNLNVPRRDLAAAAHRAPNGDVYLYAAGGRRMPFQLSQDVEAGLVHADGSVEWSIDPRVAGSPLPQFRAEAAAFVRGQFLYLLGGVVREPDSSVQGLSSDVLVTRINADGTLPQDSIVDGQTVPAWRPAGTTPPGFVSLHRTGAAAVVVGDHLFVIGGDVLQEDPPFPFVAQMNTVHRIKLREDGMLDCPNDCNWVQMPGITDASGVPFPVASGSAFVSNGKLYYMGGFSVRGHGPVLMAPLSTDENGDPVSGTWTELPTFSAPPEFDGEVDRDFAACFNLGSYLYVAGGFSLKGPELFPTAESDSLFAHLSSDGRIGP